MSYYGAGYECCNEVVSPISVLVAIGAIAVVSAFLRQAVIDNMIMGPGRRKKRATILETFLGKERKIVMCYQKSISVFIIPVNDQLKIALETRTIVSVGAKS